MTLGRKSFVATLSFAFAAALLSGCASLSFSDPAETLDAHNDSAPIVNSGAVGLKHPDDPSISSLEGLFAEKTSPLWSKETSDKCSEPLRAIHDRTESVGELENGLTELVAANPAFFHWCFYGKLLELEQSLAQETFVLDRQALVVRTFKYLAPLSKAFLRVTLDSRYYRYSIRRYQELAERVFFRKIEVLPEVTERLLRQAQAENANRAAVETDVLKRRNVSVERAPASAPAAVGVPESVPAVAAPVAPVAVAPAKPKAKAATPSATLDDPWKELDRYPAQEN